LSCGERRALKDKRLSEAEYPPIIAKRGELKIKNDLQIGAGYLTARLICLSPTDNNIQT